MTTKSKLRTGERCPLHRRTDCCGRGKAEKQVKVLKFRQLHDGTKVFPDGREVCPPAVLKRKKDRMIAAENPPICVACYGIFQSYQDIELAHCESKGMGGSRRDDRDANLRLMHRTGNRRQGSMPLDSFLELCKAKGENPCRE